MKSHKFESVLRGSIQFFVFCMAGSLIFVNVSFKIMLKDSLFMYDNVISAFHLMTRASVSHFSSHSCRLSQGGKSKYSENSFSCFFHSIAAVQQLLYYNM
jgi:hypothetical protein